MCFCEILYFDNILQTLHCGCLAAVQCFIHDIVIFLEWRMLLPRFTSSVYAACCVHRN